MSDLKILVAEDEAIVALDLRNMLRRMGYQVPLIAMSGEEAVSFAAQVQPDLIFMDIGLCGAIDGIQAAEQIRARIATQVVFVTAYGDTRTRQRAEKVMPAAFLSKPFSMDEILNAIQATFGVRA